MHLECELETCGLVFSFKPHYIMSCPTATAPIDISSANIAGKCDLKCAYQFKYTSSSCTATNRGHYLSLACDRGSSTSPPVQWNQSGYAVDEVRLYTPSLHSFGGTRAAGEVVVMHVSNTGSRPLFVCIPIQMGSAGGAGSAALHSILSAVAKNAPADGDSTAVRITGGGGGGGGFNLSNWVPASAPFYSYTATEPFQPCSGEVDYVVFDAGSSPLYISDTDLSQWTDIVQPHPYDIKPVAGAGGAGGGGVQLFYNSKGPNQGGAANDDEIYIDCQPVGESQETKWVASGGGGSNSGGGGGGGWKWGNLLENQYVQLILCVLGFFVLLFGMRWLLDWVGSRMPTLGTGGGGGREGETWMGWVRAT